jgi:hypothetical protein
MAKDNPPLRLNRVCACGCSRSLEGRRANAIYFDGACRVRAHRVRRAANPPQGWETAVVTVGGPLHVGSHVRELAA